ncbi:MAG: hypothetical protein ACR2OH_08460 [Microthrixaceae bacterium]
MAQEGEAERTYSIWWFAFAFIAMAVIGAWAVIAFGTFDRDETAELEPGPRLEPVETTTSLPTAVTMPDGQPAPDNVLDVVNDGDGLWTYLFDVDAAVMEGPTDAVVAEATVEISEDRTEITVAMQCGVAEGSVPALLEVFEDPFEVNLRPVVLGESFGQPCVPDTVVGTIAVPLEEPVGGRRVVLAQAGVPVTLAGMD